MLRTTERILFILSQGGWMRRLRSNLTKHHYLNFYYLDEYQLSSAA